MTEQKRMEITLPQAQNLLQNEHAKLDALQQQLREFQMALEETIRAQEALKNVQKAKINESILIPLGAGVYVSGSIMDNQRVQVTLGGAVLKSDTILQALQKLDTRQKEAEQQLEGLQHHFQETAANVQNLTMMLRNAQRNMENRAP